MTLGDFSISLITWSNVTGKPSLLSAGNFQDEGGSGVGWGTLASGYNALAQWRSPYLNGDYGCVYFGYSSSGAASNTGGTAIYMQLDGLVYQQGGAYRVLDMNYYYVNSDRHLKKDIHTIDKRSLNDLFNISDKLFKKFTWKDSGKDSYGLIAQEIRKYVPEAIDLDKEHNTLSVNYDVVHSKIIASLINEIKTLKNQVKSLLDNK